MGKGPLLLQNDSPFLWQFSLEPLGCPRYSAPSAALFSSSTAPTARGLLSMILPLCRTLRWPARAQLSFGLEDVEPQLILKSWDVIPKYFYLLSIYYPIFLNIINCLLGSQAGSSAEPPQHETSVVCEDFCKAEGEGAASSEGAAVYSANICIDYCHYLW